MCPLCLTSLAVTVTTTTGVGAAAVAVATRVAKSLLRPHAGDAGAATAADRTQEARGVQ
jgi:hypothetical protein